MESRKSKIDRLPEKLINKRNVVISILKYLPQKQQYKMQAKKDSMINLYLR